MGRSTSPFAPNEYDVDEAHFKTLTNAFDAISARNFSGAFDEVNKDLEFVEGLYQTWREHALNNGKEFIPFAWTGHLGSPLLYKPPYQSLEKSEERLVGEVKLGLKYDTLKMIRIASFNEWNFGSCTEPSVEDGSKYLSVLKDFLLQEIMRR